MSGTKGKEWNWRVFDLSIGYIVVVLIASVFKYQIYTSYLQFQTEKRLFILYLFNFIYYSISYGVPWLLFYSKYKITNENIQKLKFNPKYPSSSQQIREFKRTLISFIIGSTFEVILLETLSFSPPSSSPSQSPLYSTLSPLFLSIFLIFWSDLHFYLTHRLLHINWLYNKVHIVHHESFNPEPWAGLSFHPIESLIYFSSLLIFYLPILSLNLHFNFYHFHLLKTILDITPIFGHLGFGGVLGGSFFHYLHHTKKVVNYGGTPLFDRLAGTYLSS